MVRFYHVNCNFQNTDMQLSLTDFPKEWEKAKFNLTQGTNSTDFQEHEHSNLMKSLNIATSDPTFSSWNNSFIVSKTGSLCNNNNK